MSRDSKLWLTLLLVGLVVIVLLGWHDAGDGDPSAPSELAPRAEPRASDGQSGELFAAARTTEASARTPAVHSRSRAAIGDHEWQQLRRWTLGEGLEVCVRIGREPAVGAAVRLWDEPGGGHDAALRGMAPLQTAMTDVDGRVCFADLPTGYYTARTDVEGLHVVSSTVKFSMEQSSLTIVLLFGDSSIDGRVFDDGGNALANLPVRVSGIGPLPARAALTHTKDDGSFEVRGLTHGRFHVQVERGQGFDQGGQRLLSLQSGEQARMTIGRTPDAVEWRGRLLASDGQPVLGRRRFFCQRTDGNDEHTIDIDADGTFRVVLPQARWQIHRCNGLWPGAVVGAVEISTRTTYQDLAWPGAVIACKFHLAVNGHEVAVQSVLSQLQSNNGECEGPFERDGAVVMQWLLDEPGELTLQSTGSVRFAGTGADSMKLTTTAQARTDRRVIYLQP